MNTLGKKVAVIDVGSNSIKLLVAALDAVGKLQVLTHKSEETRLSSGISQQIPFLSKQSIDQGVHSVMNLLEFAREWDPSIIKIVATSAVRDATNKEDFIHAVKLATGLTITVLSGEQEALNIGAGVTQDPSLQGLTNFCLFDLGGGSLELIRYEQSIVAQAISLPLGCVRLMEQFVKNPADPMSAEVADKISSHVKHVIKESGFHFLKRPNTDTRSVLVGTGGAITVTRSIFSGMNIHSLYFLENQLESLFARVATKNIENRLLIKGLPEKRADIFPTALAIILTILRLSEEHALYHSYYSLRFGIAKKLLSSHSLS